MIINELDASKMYLPKVQQKFLGQEVSPEDTKFVDTVKSMMSDVNNQQKESAASIEKLIKGEPIDLHDVMITAEKAKTSFQLLMELRNKGLDLYREVLRIQV